MSRLHVKGTRRAGAKPPILSRRSRRLYREWIARQRSRLDRRLRLALARRLDDQMRVGTEALTRLFGPLRLGLTDGTRPPPGEVLFIDGYGTPTERIALRAWIA